MDNIHICIAKYRLVIDNSRDDIYIEATKFDDNHEAISWAVRTHGGLVMSKDGEFSYEPMPSNRDEDFFKQYRFSSPKEAISAINIHLKTQKKQS